MTRLMALHACLVMLVVTCSAQTVSLTFDDVAGPDAARLVVRENVSPSDGHTGQGVRIAADSKLACAAPAFLATGFDISLWVRHDKPLQELRFEDLVYLYHETTDERSRILLKKRVGTDYILFAMSDSTGRAKGAQFSGNWFAMKSPALDWTAGSWHQLRITASRDEGEAALYIDGNRVASAKGTEFPDQVGEHLWLGNLAGRSQMLGTLDGVQIAPAREGQQ